MAGNAAATAENLRAFGCLLRIGLASEQIHQIIGVFLVLALHRLFKPISETLAKQLVGYFWRSGICADRVRQCAQRHCRAGPCERSYFPVHVSEISTGRIGVLAPPSPQRRLDPRLHFWGLWLFPFGTLDMGSGFIPRVFGFLLFVAWLAYLVSSFTNFVVPN